MHVFAPRCEEVAELPCRFIRQNAARDGDAVIGGGRREDVEHAAGGAPLGSRQPKTRRSMRAATIAPAHIDARLFRDVERRFAEAPAAKGACRRPDRQAFLRAPSGRGGVLSRCARQTFAHRRQARAPTGTSPSAAASCGECERAAHHSDVLGQIAAGRHPRAFRRPTKKAAQRAAGFLRFIVRPEGFEPPISAFGGPRVIQLRYGRKDALLRFFGRQRCRRRQVFEEVEFVVDEAPVEFSHAIGMSEEVRSRVREIVAGRVGNVVRDLDLFHLATVDGCGQKSQGIVDIAVTSNTARAAEGFAPSAPLHRTVVTRVGFEPTT